MYAILINVLFLLVVLLITQHILEIYTKKLTKKLITIYSFLAGLISIFFCMTFPFSINEGFIVDIRIVPFIIASLYGGPLVSVGLYLFIVLYRSIIGIDFGFWGTILNYSVMPLLTFIFRSVISLHLSSFAATVSDECFLSPSVDVRSDDFKSATSEIV